VQVSAQGQKAGPSTVPRNATLLVPKSDVASALRIAFLNSGFSSTVSDWMRQLRVEPCVPTQRHHRRLQPVEEITSATRG